MLCENAIQYQRFLNECSYGVFVGQENDQDHHHGDGADQIQHKVNALKKVIEIAKKTLAVEC